MTMKNKLAVGVCLALCSGSAFSAAKVADGRGNAMGNTGVASADYLVAPFYNPALVAVYRDNDDVGLLLPAIEVSANDKDETIDLIDDAQDLFDRFDSIKSGDYTNFTGEEAEAVIDDLNDYLDDLADNAPLNVTAGAGAAIAIPNKYVAANLFLAGHIDVVAATNIAENTIDDSDDLATQAEETEDRYENSKVGLLAFGYSELGIALAKQFTIANQPITFGVSPKVQKLVTYAQNLEVDNFDADDYDQSEKTKNAFNLDVGAFWMKDTWRVGFAIKDLFKQSIDTDEDQIAGKYELTPQATVAAAYSTRFFTAAVDIDLTKQTRFEGLDYGDLSNDFDDTQFVRFGVEGNAWDWLQLRAGYEIDMQDTLDNSITAGLGISPFDVVNLDIAVSYADENQMGGSANLAFTF